MPLLLVLIFSFLLVTQDQGDNSFLEALQQNYGKPPDESKPSIYLCMLFLKTSLFDIHIVVDTVYKFIYMIYLSIMLLLLHISVISWFFFFFGTFLDD